MLKGLRHGVARLIAGSDIPWNSVENNAVFNIVGLNRKSAAGTKVNEYVAMTIPVVWACVSLIAEQISQCPVALYRRSSDGQRIKVTDHPIALLLAEPNTAAGIGMPDLMKHEETQKALWGDGFWQIERGDSGAPVALWPLESAVTTPTQSDRIDARGIEGYDTLIGKRSQSLAAADVVHFRRLSFNGYTGASPVRAAVNAVGLALAMEKFGSEFFANEAKSGGFIMHPGKLTDVAKSNIRKSVEDQQRMGSKPGDTGTGDKQSHRVKIFEEGMKWVPTTISPNESQFIESREHQIAEIARMYRIPLVLLQTSGAGSTVWGTGIESLMIGFVNQTIRPLIVSNEDEMSRKLLTVEERLDGLHIGIDESVLLVGDSVSRADVNSKACGGPWKTRNEARRADGLNPLSLPGMDEILTPTNMTDPSAPKPEPAAAPGNNGEPPNV